MDPISSPRHSLSSRRDIYRVLVVLLSAVITAVLPLLGFYFAWSWAIDQVPVANEWAGLIKVGISLIMVIVGGGATIGMAIIGGTLVATVLVAWLWQ